MSSLLPCPSCARHVRRDEKTCPFCATGLSLSPLVRSPVASVSPTERLGRAALFTFGAALVTSASACTGSVVPAYGAPIDAAAQSDAAAAPDVGPDGGGGTLYGGPPEDAAVDVDTGGSSADYGAPPAP